MENRQTSRGNLCTSFYSLEKRRVKNFNGLVSQYLPMKTSCFEDANTQFQQIKIALNKRPRKNLAFAYILISTHRIAVKIIFQQSEIFYYKLVVGLRI